MTAEIFRVDYLFSFDGKIALVFYTSGKCYQFRIINQQGFITGTEHIFYTGEAALRVARQSLYPGY